MPRVRRPGWVTPAAVAALFACATLLPTRSAHAAWTPGPRAVDLAPDLVPTSGAQVDALRRAKRALPPGSPLLKIDSAVQDRVLALALTSDPRRGVVVADLVATFDTPLVPVDESGRLLLRIAGSDVAERHDEFAKLGIEPVAVADAYGLLEAWVPYAAVTSLADLSWVRRIGTPGLPVHETGLRLSEGDAIHRADAARAAFSVNGAGATVGIISDGVTSIAQSQASSDLPPVVQVGAFGSGDEGTAMLEIVHDLAPGAGLAFHASGSGAAGMITAQDWLVTNAGASIVADDIWLPTEPYFEDGPVALNAAARVAGSDIVYITSAGNRAQRHIPQAFVDGGARTLGVLGGSRPHVFGGSDITADIRLRNPSGTGVRHTIVLQWGERFGQAGRDFDLYLVDPTFSTILALSTNAQAGTGDPVELLDFTYNGADNVPARLVIDYAGALPAPVGMRLKLAANGPTFLEYVNAAGSINPHARHPSVYALGAISAADPGADAPEPFSSRGDADMLFPAAVQRPKPDAMAIDGVTVTGVGGFPSPFFGTSAAAPHGAAIAALIRGALPALGSADVRSALSDNAVDLLTPGFDPATGAGRLDALRSLAALLNEPPVADAGPDTTVECSGASGTPVRLDGRRSSDPDGDTITYLWSAPGIVFDDATSATPTAAFPLGATTVKLVVSDASLSDDDEVVVTIEDTTPPVVEVTLDPDALWPPNHRLAPVHATVAVTDACDAAPAVRLASIASDEPDDGLGDGDAPYDVQEASIGAADFDILLRSERQGTADGRVYTVCYEAEDASGNVGTGCATVVVTHDRDLLASFTPVAPGADVTQEGGWLEFAAGDAPPAEALPDFGGDGFARVSYAGGDGDPAAGPDAATSGSASVRWFVPGEVIRRVLAGAVAPVLYARFGSIDDGALAGVPLPIAPAVFAELSAASGGALAPVGNVPGGAATPAGAATPGRLALRAPTPLRRGDTIAYATPAAGRVRVRLVTASGRRAATLVDGVQAAGWHAATVPGTLDPGVYFAVAERTGERAVTRLIVVR